MPIEQVSKKMINILLIFRNEDPKTAVRAILESTYPNQLKITEIPLIQDALECLEKKEAAFDLIFFEHESTSRALVTTLLNNGGKSIFVMCSSDEANFKNLSPQPECLLTKDISTSFYRILKKFSISDKLPPLPDENEEAYVTINPHTLLGGNPLKSDIFVLMGQGHYVRLFRKGDGLEVADLQRYLNKQIVALFYMKKSDCLDVVKSHAQSIDAIAAKPVVSASEAESTFLNSSALVRDLVSQIGFTPETQEVAKSSVNLALKSMGSSPKLSLILRDLKGKKDDYISSHSYMVGQVACALAHQLEWNSTGTYYKLTLAAFLHDIALNDTTLAEVRSLDEAKKSGKFTNEQLQLIKMHPMKAAEYSQQFSEIPSDIDQIIAQHHERPDGTGFPRGLGGKSLTPLSSLFIVAHDLVDYSAIHPEASITTFFEEKKGSYDVGQFKKIVAGII